MPVFGEFLRTFTLIICTGLILCANNAHNTHTPNPSMSQKLRVAREVASRHRLYGTESEVKARRSSWTHWWDFLTAIHARRREDGDSSLVLELEQLAVQQRWGVNHLQACRVPVRSMPTMLVVEASRGRAEMTPPKTHVITITAEQNEAEVEARTTSPRQKTMTHKGLVVRPISQYSTNGA